MIKLLIRKLCYRIYLAGKYVEEEKTYDRLRRRYKLHPTFRFNGSQIKFYGDGEIEIGAHSYIGEYSTIQAFKDCRVVIGERCSISHNVRLYTQSSVSDQDFSSERLENKTGNITIENYVWIGANVFISPGITIGTNAVVGANSVVTKDIEPFSIVGGVPARLIRKKNLPGVS